MHLKTVIHLSGPICSCEEQHLSWVVVPEVHGDITGNGVKIICKTCGTSIHVPWKQWHCQFVLEKPYPGKKPVEKEVKKDDDGKVVFVKFQSEDKKS